MDCPSCTGKVETALVAAEGVESVETRSTAGTVLVRYDPDVATPEDLREGIEGADIALVGDDLSRLPYLYELADRANGVIRQNIYASLAAKALLAVGVPLGYVSVALAVLAGDAGMTVGVTANAMRLSRLRPEGGTGVSSPATG
jgi:cation transport ATPase